MITVGNSTELPRDDAVSRTAEQVVARDVRTIARLATMIEREDPFAIAVLNDLYRQSGRSHVIGITGPPGAGKSTLIGELISHYRSQGKRVGVIAVDPTSPLTGGATLGDRVRMMQHHADPDVFVRSMANRGQAGGLAPTTAAMVSLLEAADFDPVIIETVGVGQSEIAITRLAETTILVQVPGAGDSVQALKAGLLELSDILVVGKADLPGAQQLARDLRAMLSLSIALPGEWAVPVVLVSATEASGIETLAQAIEQHDTYLHASGEGARRRQQRAGFEISALIEAALARATTDPAHHAELAELIRAVAAREQSPGQAAESLVKQITQHR